MANTYGLYQNHFDKLAEVIAYYELGLREEGWDTLIEVLEEDRGKFFDEEALQKKLSGHMRKIKRLRPELAENLIDLEDI